MRIIAGMAKKRLLKVPSGWTGRPTADRVKESLFSILGGFVPECRFLDLFAGTGNVGIEALSRGAGMAVFVEKDRRAASAIRHNLSITGFERNSRLIVRDVFGALAELEGYGEAFDVVFLDPPYGAGLETPVMESVLAKKLLSPGGVMIAESSKRDQLPSVIMESSLYRRERYGDTIISFYKIML
ncbi:MAG: 16S rRNA (guanine(966)-N(2))-methyltransferase RsmD [Bacillota bacterium]